MEAEVPEIIIIDPASEREAAAVGEKIGDYARKEMMASLARARIRTATFFRTIRQSKSTIPPKTRLAVMSGLVSFFGPGGCFPSYRTMEKEFGVDHNRCKAVIDWAKKNHLLEVAQRGHKNYYTIRW